MGAVLTGIAAAVVIAVGAGLIMRSENVPSWRAYEAAGVRVGDPGSNLVGPHWTGENDAGAAAAGDRPTETGQLRAN